MEGAAPVGAGAASFVSRAKFSDLDFAPPRLALASRWSGQDDGAVAFAQ